MPPFVKRWRFQGAGEDWTVPQNPLTMGSPFPAKAVQARSTTGGRALLFQGATPPVSWQFGGSIRSVQHYEGLRHWVYDVTGRIVITDHFGRDIECVLTDFKPEPKRTNRVYWRHEYTVTGLVLSVTQPTYGLTDA